MLNGSCIPTCLVPKNSACEAASLIQQDLDSPGETMAKQWTKLVEELEKLPQLREDLRKTLREHVLHIQQLLKEQNTFQLQLAMSHVSIFPTFENKEMYKVELVVGPELRSVQLAVFQSLVQLGGTVKFDMPPRRRSERIAQDVLRNL